MNQPENKESTGSLSLNPVGGQLGYQKAKHLLNRCTFGPRQSEVNFMKTKTAQEAVDFLLASPSTALSKPLGVFTTDLEVPVGQTWTSIKYNNTYGIQRLYSYRAWWMGRMLNQGLSLYEKMVLFWHNHFVIETDKVTNMNFNYIYNVLLYDNALGNFKTLTQEITRNVGMLVYLDGVLNMSGSPNENYARELFELFTIGKGPLIDTGNYTNYTEADIQQAAKVLTGWKTNTTNDTSYFDITKHDKTTKTFSVVFGNQTIDNKDAEEYKYLINMIFQKKETAKFLVRKLYRWFLYYEIDDIIEKNIIEPLADIFHASDYDLKTLLKAFLCSEHFYDDKFHGAVIKSPIELTVGLFRAMEVEQPPESNIVARYSFWNWMTQQTEIQNMALGNPPDVAGWPAWYLAPMYNEIWVNSATVPQRATTIRIAVQSGIKTGDMPVKVVMDPFKVAYLATNPSDINDLLQTLAALFLPAPSSADLITKLKETMIPGLPDYEWTVEWNKYVNNPADLNQKTAVANRIISMMMKMTSLPEFQLM